MATITEDYVSFETAKLLKEKGFNAKCNKCYAYFADDDIRCLNLKYSKSAQSLIENRHPCITLQMAMKWLREVHDIDISIIPLRSHKEYLPRVESDILDYDAIPYKKYEEACEAAIKYCLENLI